MLHYCSERRSRSAQKRIIIEAPFVHPFRSSTNHAQHLRSVDFARVRNARILWIVAHDDFMSIDKMKGNSINDSAKQNWLMYDDRWTAGIPGFMPLVLDLPIRLLSKRHPGIKCTLNIYTFTCIHVGLT